MPIKPENRGRYPKDWKQIRASILMRAGMSEFHINGDMFGLYAKIPTGFSRDIHTYKIVSRINSNTYCDIRKAA